MITFQYLNSKLFSSLAEHTLTLHWTVLYHNDFTSYQICESCKTCRLNVFELTVVQIKRQAGHDTVSCFALDIILSILSRVFEELGVSEMPGFTAGASEGKSLISQNICVIRSPLCNYNTSTSAQPSVRSFMFLHEYLH